MLALNNVSAGYGSFRALFDVSLEVKAGETVAVIGPNGAGKTTLLRVISRLIEPAAGDITMEGKHLNHVPPHELIGYGIAHVPGKPPTVPAAQRRGQSAHGCVLAVGARQVRRASGARVSAVPAHEGAPPTARGHAFRRRAADVRDRPRADVRARSCCCSTSRRPGSHPWWCSRSSRWCRK